MVIYSMHVLFPHVRLVLEDVRFKDVARFCSSRGVAETLEVETIAFNFPCNEYKGYGLESLFMPLDKVML
jgi:hypothetical protein